MKLSFSLLFALATSAYATTDLYVNPTGASGAYTTVQAAVNAAPAGAASNRTIIHIAPGRYKEQITVPATKPFLSFVGQTTDPTKVVLTYNLNVTSPNGSGGTLGTIASTTVVIYAADFVAKNVMFQNGSHDNIAQALAIYVRADRLAFSNCSFFGFQDTVFLGKGRQYFTQCHITGDTDFIYGDATALFNSCYINESSTWGYLTAASTAPTTPIGFVFKYCALTKGPVTAIDPETGTRYSNITSVSDNATYLGRPWQYTTTKASVTFISCKLDTHIIDVGWSPWDSGNSNPAATTRYSEYGNKDITATNAIDVSKRVSWSHQLTSTDAGRYTVSHIFGPVSYWGSGYQDWGGSYVAWDPIAALNSVPNQ
jgi:pectin methylesterase-like acyl-CoA thioesterase